MIESSSAIVGIASCPYHVSCAAELFRKQTQFSESKYLCDHGTYALSWKTIFAPIYKLGFSSRIPMYYTYEYEGPNVSQLTNLMRDRVKENNHDVSDESYFSS